MFKSIITFILVGWLVFPINLLACSKEVSLLNKGDTAPCTGYLFSPEKEQEVRIKVQQYKLLEETVQLYQKKEQLYSKQEQYLNQIIDKERQLSSMWRQTAVDVTQKYARVEENRGKRDWFFLGSGVLLTVLAAWSLRQVK